MKTTIYLSIDRWGKNARVTTRAVQPPYQGICIPLKLEIPDAHFTRPTLEIKFPEPKDGKIKVDIDLGGIEEAILVATGLDARVVLEDNEPSEEKP